jgi:hypothetical protein
MYIGQNMHNNSEQLVVKPAVCWINSMKKTEKLTVERTAKTFPVFMKAKLSLSFPKQPPIRPEIERDIPCVGRVAGP